MVFSRQQHKMYILMRQTLATASQVYAANEIYEVEKSIGQLWIIANIAVQTTTPPPHIDRFHALLDHGADQPCLFLPHLGEFGHKIMTGIRIVHWHKASEKIVCCKPGEEVLYPSATQFVTDWKSPITDAMTVGTMQSPT